MRVALVLIVLALTPAAASAGVVSIDGTTLRYTAAAGDADDIGIRRSGSDMVVSSPGTTPITEDSASCSAAANVVTCTGVAPALTHALAVGLDGDDRFSFSDLGAIAGEADLGPGDDFATVLDEAQPFRLVATGGPGLDFMIGGMLGDTLAGGDDNDLMDGRAGPDDLSGGGGFDEVRYDSAAHNGGVEVRLDDQANDGRPSEQDNAHSDLEAVRGTEEPDVLVGTAGPNVLVGTDGDDQITGGGGIDVLIGDEFPIVGEVGNDTIFARDGLAEYVSCGPGTDTVVSDDIDEVNGCETIDSAPVPGPPPPPADPDGDGDGFAAHRECDDARADVFPGATEVLGNGVDEDCNRRDAPGLAVRTQHGATTRFKRLRVLDLAADDTVRVSGAPKRCRIRRRTIAVERPGALSLHKRLPRRLRPGCVVRIRVTRGDRAVTLELTIRRRKPPELARG